MSGSSLDITVTAVAMASLVLAAVTDFRHRIIPNGLVLAVMITGIALRSDAGFRPLVFSLLVCVAVVVSLGILASYRLIGWGDVKLIGAATLLLPVRETMPLIATIAIAGGLMSCAYLIAQRLQAKPGLANSPGPGGTIAAGPRHGLAGMADREGLRIRSGEPMPYAVAVLAGVAYQTATEAILCWPATLCWH